MDTAEHDEPVTPAGRFFLQPKTENIINCAIGGKLPVDIDAIKAELHRTLLKHPRFCSILVTDEHGVDHWRKTEVDLDKHLVFPDPSQDKDDAAGNDAGDGEIVNQYLAELAVSSPLDLSKPPWEIHVLKSQRCCVLRLHHALGDGISLMSLFLASCRRTDQPHLPPTIPGAKSHPSQTLQRLEFRDRVWKWAKAFWLTWVYVIEFVLHSLWMKDKPTAISGGAGVELWPRTVATARFALQDMKIVKGAVNGTINDVLLGIISSGLARYLKMRSDGKIPKGLRITGLALVNIRPQPGLQELSRLLGSDAKIRWGNQMGYMALPVCLHKGIEDPLEYLKRAKAMLDKKKLSLEAHFSYKLGALIMALFGPKVASLLNYRIMANTTFTITNIVGPQEEIMFAGNPIAYLRTSSSSIPHVNLYLPSFWCFIRTGFSARCRQSFISMHNKSQMFSLQALAVVANNHHALTSKSGLLARTSLILEYQGSLIAGFVEKSCQTSAILVCHLCGD